MRRLSKFVRTCIHSRGMPDGREFFLSDKEIFRSNPDGLQGKSTQYGRKKTVQTAFSGCEYRFLYCRCCPPILATGRRWRRWVYSPVSSGYLNDTTPLHERQGFFANGSRPPFGGRKQKEGGIPPPAKQDPPHWGGSCLLGLEVMPKGRRIKPRGWALRS